MTRENLKSDRGLAPWRPTRELEELGRSFEDLFGRSLLPAGWGRTPLEVTGWMPAIEVFEKEDKFLVKADLPGITEEDISVSAVGDTLTIRGERKAESEVKEEDYYCCERSYGSFFRSIALPSHVNADKIEASYDNGVLEVSLPKIPEVKPKKIAVTAKKKAVKQVK
jgi:HSP20 family protein